jgi:2-methylcitrate dehydratase PrpD
MGATEELARWIVRTSSEDIPPDALRVAGEACFDCLGVMLAGSVQPLGRIITRLVGEWGGSPEATVVVSGIKTSVPSAALANGTMGHALDYDDMGGFGHPTTVLFPALLALGEKVGASGRDILEAYVIGCEVGINLAQGGLTQRYHQMKRGFHSTAIFGRMAAASACARLLKLDEHQTKMALGIAGSMASGLIHNFGTMTKPLHAGMAARDGAMAALLAREGWTAGERVIEHPLGFIASFYGEDKVDPEELVKGLGKPFRTQDAIIIKKYPCCGGNHSMLDSLLGLMREHKFSYEDVERVEVDQPYLSVVMLYKEPKDGLSGKFSILYNTAAALREGRVDIHTFTDEKAMSREMQEAMQKVVLDVKPKWVSGSEAIQAGTPVRVYLKDGRVLTRNTPRERLLGTQQNPWGMENIEAKFRTNAGLALPEGKVEKAVEVWSRIGEIGDLAQALSIVVADR